MKHFLNVLLLALIFTAGHATAFACSCAPPEGPSAELGRASAVFSGRVIEVRGRKGAGRTPGMVEAVFEAARVWKGAAGKQVGVYTNPDSAACGYAFEAGRSYLVYARGGGGRLTTGLCSRTKRLEDAGADLDELGPGREVAGGSGGGPDPAREVKLRAGEGAALKAEGLVLRFVSVVGDSRCPQGVTCVWAGDAQIRIMLRRAGGKFKTYTLHAGRPRQQDAAYGGYIVRLVGLSPRPKAGQPARAGGYVATFAVTRARGPLRVGVQR